SSIRRTIPVAFKRITSNFQDRTPGVRLHGCPDFAVWGNDVPTDGIIRKFFLAMPTAGWICLEVIFEENPRKIWRFFTKELEKSW
ncbi:hypothetical protein, partial [Oscillibacter sp. CAG:155]|uniref:hypothetical protein n=1 Tax=Oscillibacter sp. CAG:155 TaxID=1262910 RepID=UPI00263F91CF